MCRYCKQNWINKIITNNVEIRGLCRKDNHFALLVGMQTGVAIVESSMEFPQTTKNGLAFWLSYLTSEILEGTPNPNMKEHKHPYTDCSIIYNRQNWKQPKCPSLDE